MKIFTLTFLQLIISARIFHKRRREDKSFIKAIEKPHIV